MFGRKLRPLTILVVFNTLTESAGTLTGIRPNCGSYNGGQLITIMGDDLRSNRFDINAGELDTTPGQGFDYEIWFEAGGSTVPCDVNAMDITYGTSRGVDFIICKTRPFPIYHRVWDDTVGSRNLC